MSAASFALDNLVALVDCNGIQADGAIVLEMEPVAEKWRAFGWETSEIDGNDMDAIVDALRGARSRNRPPEGDRAAHLAGHGACRRIETARAGAFRPGRAARMGRSRRGTGDREAELRPIRLEPARHAALGHGRGRAGRRRERRSAVRAGAGRRSAARGPTSSGSPPISANTPTSCPSATPSPTASSMSAWRSRTWSPSRPAWRAPGYIPYCTTYGVFATPARLRLHRHRLRAQRAQREDHSPDCPA